MAGATLPSLRLLVLLIRRSNQNKIHKCLNENRADFRVISHRHPGQREMALGKRAKNISQGNGSYTIKTKEIVLQVLVFYNESFWFSVSFRTLLWFQHTSTGNMYLVSLTDRQNVFPKTNFYFKEAYESEQFIICSRNPFSF